MEIIILILIGAFIWLVIFLYEQNKKYFENQKYIKTLLSLENRINQAQCLTDMPQIQSTIEPEYLSLVKKGDNTRSHVQEIFLDYERDFSAMKERYKVSSDIV